MTHCLIVAAMGFLLAVVRTHFLALVVASVMLMLVGAFAASSFGDWALTTISDLVTIQVAFMAGQVFVELAARRWPALFGEAPAGDERAL